MSKYDLTQGLAKKHNDGQGGLKKIYLTEYVDYSRSQVVISDESITSIPTATIYEYDVYGASFEETQTREDGGEVYSQKLSFVVKGTRNSEEFWKLTKKPHHCIIVDEQGNGRFLGIRNGVEAIVSDKTGANKSDLNGYTIEIDGKEDNQAYFIADLSNSFTIVSGIPDGCPADLTLFEMFPEALVGYSLRNLSPDIVSVVRVRRDSDDAEQDFTAEEITDGTLASFTGANNGLVSVWYDQSGNANNMTEATLSNQPTLVSNGVVNLENGKPCIVFNDNILGTSITNQEGAESLFTIASDFRDGAMVALLKNTTADKILLYESSEEARLRYNGTSPNLAKAEDFLQNSYVAINDSTDFNFYKNKELVGTDTGASFVNTTNRRLNIGSRYEGNLMAEVKVQEVIYYASDLTASSVSLVENQEEHYNLGLFESKMFLVPDASGGDVGEGFTITGIFVDEAETALKPEGQFVIYCSNQGKNIQTPSWNGLPNKASIVKLLINVNATDLSVPTLLQEIKVYENVNFGQGVGMQGICLNNNDNIAIVGGSKIYIYTKGGAFVSSHTISGDNPNGLAFDSANNYYLVYSSTGSLRRFDTDFNLVDTFTIGTGGDQLFYNNDTNKLYLSVDPSGYKIYDSSFNEEFVSGELDRVLAMEGIATSGRYMFIGNDGYYHENTPYDFNAIGVFRYKK